MACLAARKEPTVMDMNFRTIMFSVAMLYVFAIIASPATATAYPPENDAYAAPSPDGLSWTIGNAALELQFQLDNGALRLTGFKNKLCPGAANYVDPAIALPAFLAENAGGFQAEVLWTKPLTGAQSADPAADNLKIEVKQGDLLGFEAD